MESPEITGIDVAMPEYVPNFDAAQHGSIVLDLVRCPHGGQAAMRNGRAEGLN
jgi:hypothetical protein